MRIRKTFIMSLNPGCEEEYKRRHDDLWPRLKEVMKSHGVHNYSISLCRETHQLFGYAEIDSEAQWSRIANTGECREWWKYMSDIMAVNPDNSPKSIGLSEVFFME
jgi:L-rhamnose mutarotase